MWSKYLSTDSLAKTLKSKKGRKREKKEQEKQGIRTIKYGKTQRLSDTNWGKIQRQHI